MKDILVLLYCSGLMVNNGFISITARTVNGYECAGSVCVLHFHLWQLLRTFEILRQLLE